jgi:hypothetical protein
MAKTFVFKFGGASVKDAASIKTCMKLYSIDCEIIQLLWFPPWGRQLML